ncbi:hypothetical protein ACFOZ7_19045 [Natribaculum luteum]|uniref:DUF7344 domain-containing protein n=1 Tax=Natribaculum luteum TaxID=1586232 RepID=A0ABD5P481_9EURY|nr:hypothetical protein [Natribaculum luteum]
MTIDTSNVEPASTDPSLPASTVFELLLDRHRRYVLYYLFETVGEVSLEELADRLARWDGKPTESRRECVRIELHHNHVPRLTDARVARYHPSRDTVELLPAARQLEPHLDLVADSDR